MMMRRTQLSNLLLWDSPYVQQVEGDIAADNCITTWTKQNKKHNKLLNVRNNLSLAYLNFSWFDIFIKWRHIAQDMYIQWYLLKDPFCVFSQGSVMLYFKGP